ncbi:unnamed protein product [Brachionus calyciflorus]|uniref:Uncharacterized protein n=1 Tax=Brachionus calyciflorus TaxID=104777 RepID=A0A813MQZ8_9BILA|nr:unnamed protein product [Brachionus calyciflorus]
MNLKILNKIDLIPTTKLFCHTLIFFICLKIFIFLITWSLKPSKSKLNRTVSKYDHKILIDVDCSSIDLCQKSINKIDKQNNFLLKIFFLPFLPFKFFYQSLIDKPFDHLGMIVKLIILILLELKNLIFTVKSSKIDSKIVYSQNLAQFNQSLLDLIDNSEPKGGSLRYKRSKKLSKMTKSVMAMNSNNNNNNNSIEKRGSNRFKIEYKIKKFRSNHLCLNLHRKCDSEIETCDKNVVKPKVDQTTYSRKTGKKLLNASKNIKTKSRKSLNVYK